MVRPQSILVKPISGSTATPGTHVLGTVLVATKDGEQHTFTDRKTFEVSPPTVEVSPRPCSDQAPGEGTSFGDPHLQSFDGTQYSFQAVGEFVLARSTLSGDPFEVQVRYTPVQANVSGNAALAVRIGQDRVGVYANVNAPATVKINGETIHSTDPWWSRTLSSGATVTLKDALFTLSTADGKMITVFLPPGVLGTVSLHVPASQQGQWVGLLGNFDHNGVNDFQLKDGTLLPYYPSNHDLYRRFGESWRITQQESLFDYEAGTSTQTFTDSSQPSLTVNLSRFPAEEILQADRICREAGVISPGTLDSCIFDVVVTQDPEWAAMSRFADPRAKQVTVHPGVLEVTTGQTAVLKALVPVLLDDREVLWEASEGTLTVLPKNAVEYTAPATPGTYTLTARLKTDPQVQFSVPVVVKAPAVYKIFLDWPKGAASSDLDAHLWLPSSRKYHVYYARPGDEDSQATLERDQAREGSAPSEIQKQVVLPDDYIIKGDERIDAREMEKVKLRVLAVEGHYEYWVHALNGSLSGATVYLTDVDNQWLEQAEVPEGASGVWWHVLNLDARSGRVTWVNEVKGLVEPYWDQGWDCAVPEMATPKPIWTPCQPH
ncbi:hypothetical protein DC3_24450 [Deinococcus cellulosilyticus NBRC 106333 = KACC 11606]|uniref:VWFD domain-containing protein n=1 Tax=Deinococcus cellulosilyticus (strain DSM 18568 / NBRC 106333 / KACC 11606 / 5516J-15) TaxID=1223518 RepID=A0A511N1T1_DEIC1|nr:hypothetical protein DC3_24450 [Deinococcus cellulosilyticus NBRC 106333 = KACC 11606]